MLKQAQVSQAHLTINARNVFAWPFAVLLIGLWIIRDVARRRTVSQRCGVSNCRAALRYHRRSPAPPGSRSRRPRTQDMHSMDKVLTGRGTRTRYGMPLKNAAQSVRRLRTRTRWHPSAIDAMSTSHFVFLVYSSKGLELYRELNWREMHWLGKNVYAVAVIPYSITIFCVHSFSSLQRSVYKCIKKF